jgi:hypothetical protein
MGLDSSLHEGLARAVQDHDIFARPRGKVRRDAGRDGRASLC